MKMLNDTIAVTIIPDEDRVTSGGLISVAKNPYEKGRVESVPKEYEGTLSVGEVVLFQRGTGETVVVDDGTEFRFISIRNLKAAI